MDEEQRKCILYRIFLDVREALFFFFVLFEEKESKTKGASFPMVIALLLCVVRSDDRHCAMVTLHDFHIFSNDFLLLS